MVLVLPVLRDLHADCINYFNVILKRMELKICSKEVSEMHDHFGWYFVAYPFEFSLIEGGC